MDLATFFNHFELLADAPNSIQKLRELILQLAVQGKLVPQDPNDEPASVLLEKIKAEKWRSLKEGKIKKSKKLPAIKADEVPYDLPDGWNWQRFDTICSYIQRGKSPKYTDYSEILVISQKCVQWNGLKLDRARFIETNSLQRYGEERFLRTGDILWNSTGTGTIGRACIYMNQDNSYRVVVADSHVTVLRTILIKPQFVICWLASAFVQNEVENIASGTTKQVELNTSTVKHHLVPLPPLNEQHRIVAKVDHLMFLCDTLETQLNQANKEREKLMTTAIHQVLVA